MPATMDRSKMPLEPTLTRAIIDKYDGDRSCGLCHGRGRAEFRDGSRYEGEFKDNMMHGSGTYTWPDGTVYEGEFVDNRMQGRGRYSWPDGSVYEGGISDGLRHGSGVLRCGFCPSEYDGEWVRGRRHGVGTIWYDEEKRCFYRGAWRDDLRHGDGVMQYASGNTFDGSWVRDRKEGRGVMSWTDRGEVYEGEWRDDLPHGRGTHVWLQSRRPGEVITPQKQVGAGGGRAAGRGLTCVCAAGAEPVRGRVPERAATRLRLVLVRRRRHVRGPVGGQQEARAGGVHTAGRADGVRGV